MEEIRNTDNKVTDGFSFDTDRDADVAALERRKVDYMESRMDYSDPEAILRIYNQAIHDRVFKTPIGILYLKQIQEYLLKQESIDEGEVAPIPIYQSFSNRMREESSPAKTRVKPSEAQKEKKRASFALSVILNILLGMAIVAMFIITLNAEQPNVLNYEKVITNRYAEWEQQLTQREQAVREKERELQMETE